MKRLSKNTLLALWAVALSFSISCAKQEAEQPADSVTPGEETDIPFIPDPSGKKVYCTISAAMPTDRLKTTVSAEGKVVWAVGDQIGAFADNGKIYEFHLVAGAGGENATFNCTDEDFEGHELAGYAVYPYTEGLTYDAANDKIEIAVPATQSTAISSAPMIATLSGSYAGGYRYFFRNLGGVFQFTYRNVPPQAKKLKFTAATDISGVFTLNGASDNLTTAKTAASSGSATKQIMVTLPLAHRGDSVVVQIPVSVGDYSGFSIALCDKDGAEIASTKKTPGSTIKAKLNTLSPIKPIPLPEGLKVKWTWDNGGNLAQFDSNVPAIDAQGNVYIMANSAYLYKVDRNGNKLWDFALSGVTGNNQSSPCLEADGSVVYVAAGTTNGELFAVTSSGSQKWKFDGYSNPMTAHSYAENMVAVSDGDNVYVPCNWTGHPGDGRDNGTVLSIDKSSGSRIGYLAYQSSGTAFLGTASGSIAVSAAGTVGYQSCRGVYTMKQADLDNPPLTHATYGKYLHFGYRDTYGTWSYIKYTYNEQEYGSMSQGVICGRKGPTSGANVMVSCYQRGAAMLVTCNDADKIKNLNNETTDGTTLRDPNDAGRYYYWRFPFGSNQSPANFGDWDPAIQDKGGIVLGHDDLVVLLPLKQSDGASTRMWRPAGVMALSMGRNATQETHQNFSSASTSVVNDATMAAMRNWRFVIRPTASSGVTPKHSVEANPGVNGAPAVDNNGWIHIASNDCYHIIDSPARDTGDGAAMYSNITSKTRVEWIDLLNASGLLDYEVTSAEVISSVKIGNDGRMYVNVNVNGSKGVTVCMTYPGVTGPDPTSSWPQKGADPRNSCCQVHDPSTWTTNNASWD